LNVVHLPFSAAFTFKCMLFVMSFNFSFIRLVACFPHLRRRRLWVRGNPKAEHSHGCREHSDGRFHLMFLALMGRACTIRCRSMPYRPSQIVSPDQPCPLVRAESQTCYAAVQEVSAYGSRVLVLRHIDTDSSDCVQSQYIRK
jgi:hypothetical protein